MDSKEKLLQAATQLFADKGFAAVAIREVAREAGVNSALISYHFGGKVGLYQTVIERQFSILLTEAKKIEDSELLPVDRIKRYAAAINLAHKHSPFLIRLMYSELFAPTPCFSFIVDQFIAKLNQLLQTALQDGIADGTFRDDLMVEQAVIALAGIVNFYFISRPFRKLLNHSEDCVEDYIQQAISIYLKGIEREKVHGKTEY